MEENNVVVSNEITTEEVVVEETNTTAPKDPEAESISELLPELRDLEDLEDDEDDFNDFIDPNNNIAQETANEAIDAIIEHDQDLQTKKDEIVATDNTIEEVTNESEDDAIAKELREIYNVKDEVLTKDMIDRTESIKIDALISTQINDHKLPTESDYITHVTSSGKVLKFRCISTNEFKDLQTAISEGSKGGAENSVLKIFEVAYKLDLSKDSENTSIEAYMDTFSNVEISDLLFALFKSAYRNNEFTFANKCEKCNKVSIHRFSDAKSFLSFENDEDAKAYDERQINKLGLGTDTRKTILEPWFDDYVIEFASPSAYEQNILLRAIMKPNKDKDGKLVPNKVAKQFEEWGETYLYAQWISNIYIKKDGKLIPIDLYNGDSLDKAFTTKKRSIAFYTKVKTLNKLFNSVDVFKTELIGFLITRATKVLTGEPLSFVHPAVTCPKCKHETVEIPHYDGTFLLFLQNTFYEIARS